MNSLSEPSACGVEVGSPRFYSPRSKLIRDRRLFEAEFQLLKTEAIKYLPWLPYLLSGGVTMRDLAPRLATRPIIARDKFLPGLRPLLALHWFVRLRRL
jgi:hypothetical protein